MRSLNGLLRAHMTQVLVLARPTVIYFYFVFLEPIVKAQVYEAVTTGTRHIAATRLLMCNCRAT